MRVVIPYVPRFLHADVLSALVSCNPEAVDVSASDFAYGELLVRLWSPPFDEDLLLVEHDVVVGFDTVDQLITCACEWGAFPYLGANGEEITGLGCVRFRRGFMATHPDAMMRAVGSTNPGGLPPGHWVRLDGWIRQALLPFEPHVHHPCVTHHHDPTESRCDGVRPLAIRQALR